MKRHQEQRKALGSQAVFTIVVEDKVDKTSIYDKLWEIVDSFEEKFSRFLSGSELTHFNEQAGEKVEISSEFAKLLEASIAMSHKTDGLFNPFILPSLNKSGYIGSWPNPNKFTKELNYEDRTKVVPINELRLGSAYAEIPSNTALDFGGIGKGYLLDKLGEYLVSQDINNFWLSLGGDILCSGHDVDIHPWSVSIQHATEDSELVGSISNDRATIGIATSGITKRKGVRDEVSWHHIIDPRTGKPAKTDILTATVSAVTATDADIIAKCLVIAGSTETQKLVNKFNLKKAYIQLMDGQTKILKESSYDSN